MTEDAVMMAVILRAIPIVRVIAWQITVVVMMSRILGILDYHDNRARVTSNDWRLETEKNSKHQDSLENGSHHRRDRYNTDWRRQAYREIPYGNVSGPYR